MSVPLINPFNFQPYNVTAGNGSYTVPANRYAKVTITLHASTRFNTITQTITGPVSQSTNADSRTIDLWLKAGDAISFSTAQTNAGAFSGVTNHSFLSQATAILNGVTICNLVVHGSVDYGGTGTISGTATGGQNVSYVAQEYLIPS